MRGYSQPLGAVAGFAGLNVHDLRPQNNYLVPISGLEAKFGLLVPPVAAFRNWVRLIKNARCVSAIEAYPLQ